MTQVACGDEAKMLRVVISMLRSTKASMLAFGTDDRARAETSPYSVPEERVLPQQVQDCQYTDATLVVCSSGSGGAR